MKTNRKLVMALALALLLGMFLVMLILPVFATGGDYGIPTGSTPGGPTPFLSVNEPTDTPTEAPTATATPDN